MSYLILLIFFWYVLTLLPKQEITSYLDTINISIVSPIILFFLVVIMGGNNSNPDAPVYNTIYNMGLNYTKDPGFAHIMVFFSSRGWPYEMVRLLLVFVGLVLVSFTVKKYVPARYRSFTYLLYFVFPFFMDAVQLRNFLVMCILTFSFPLLNNRKISDKLIYIVLIWLASTLQQVASVYYLLVFLYYVIKNKKLKYIFLKVYKTLLVLILILGWNPKIISIFSNTVNSYMGNDFVDLSHYLVVSTKWGWIIYWLNIFINIFLLKLSVVYSKNYEAMYPFERARLSYKLSDLAEFILYVNLTYIFILPFIVINVDFYRIYRNFSILNYIVYTNIILTYGKKSQFLKRNRIKTLTVMMIVNVILTFIWQFPMAGMFDLIVKAVMDNNWIIR